MSEFAFEAPFGVKVIEQIIPHRHPFLLVDRIEELGSTWVRGYKQLSAGEPVFQGHFPGEPVYPGVLQIETVAQVGACWILARHENRNKIAYLMTVESAKFRRPAYPGDRLDIYGEITNLRSRTGRVVSNIQIDSKIISEIVLTFAFQKQDGKGA